MKISSPYEFVIVDAGDRFPRVLIDSGDSATELVGYYSLRQLGIEAAGPATSADPVLGWLFFDRVLPREAWIVDAWFPGLETSEPSGDRSRNLALVVKGLPMPLRLGARGRSIHAALQKQLAVLGDALVSADDEVRNFHLGLITAILGELDRLGARYERQRGLLARVFLIYMLLALFGALFAGISAIAPDYFMPERKAEQNSSP